jgi:2,3-dihydroxyethylbenzene 1,2-dioxygenase
LRQDDIPGAVRFYEMLGLTGSVEYKLPLPGGMVAQPYFMHVNGRQHSVAFGAWADEEADQDARIYRSRRSGGGARHHPPAQDRRCAAAGQAFDRRGFDLLLRQPSGWLWELGWGAKKADNQQEYYSRDIFGHGNEAAGYGMDIEL